MGDGGGVFRVFLGLVLGVCVCVLIHTQLPPPSSFLFLSWLGPRTWGETWERRENWRELTLLKERSEASHVLVTCAMMIGRGETDELAKGSFRKRRIRRRSSENLFRGGGVSSSSSCVPYFSKAEALRHAFLLLCFERALPAESLTLARPTL